MLSASAHTCNSNMLSVTAPCAWCCLTLGATWERGVDEEQSPEQRWGGLAAEPSLAS